MDANVSSVLAAFSSAIAVKDCTVSNNTLEGSYVFEKYPANENVIVE